MAVEIKEIVIRAVITDAKETASLPATPDNDQTAIIQLCVEQVLKILKKKNIR
jgi:hypothetical protein